MLFEGTTLEFSGDVPRYQKRNTAARNVNWAMKTECEQSTRTVKKSSHQDIIDIIDIIMWSGDWENRIT